MLIEILSACAIVALIGVPLVITFDKWKKEMDEDEEGAGDERSE